MATELAFSTALELREAYRSLRLSPVEVIDALAARVEALDPLLGAFYTLTLETARAEASAAERAWARREARPLEGIPFGVKDLFDTAGVRTTYGSPMYDAHVPQRDAHAVARARAAGAILVGKTATDEFAYGIAGVNPHYGPARNPWSSDRVSGGSSSGSAVAVAAGLVPLALGSDTGGSIRAPSSFCGVVGLKGTWDAISLEGMWPMGRSLDHVGPMARTPADAALFHAVLAEGSRGRPVARALAEPLRPAPSGTRVGVCRDLTLIPPTDAVRSILDAAVTALADSGCEVREVAFPEAAEVIRVFVPIRDAETLSAHRAAGLFPARRADYSELTYTRLAAAEAVDLDAYLAASRDRRRLAEGFAALFEDVDVLVLPTMTAVPPRIDDDQPDLAAWDAIGLHMIPENLFGVPAVAVRAGFDQGLPVGVQIAGREGADATVLAVAEAFVQATPDVQRRRPEL